MNDTLVIDRGDLSSLALLAIQPDAAGVVLWHAPEHDAAQPMRLSMVRRHAELFSASRLIVLEHAIVLPAPDRRELFEANMLIQAANAAVSLGCSRVLWPRQMGNGADHRAIADALERTATISLLTASSGASNTLNRAIGIDLPLIDVNDVQLVDLAEDAGAPMTAWWPCDGASHEPCEACHQCQRWRDAFASAGIEWPWHSALAA
ncbi:MAG TPA: 7-cyano-7-deazaguanine synthase [Phycisphaerales bacterium]|nr:7-cyano-7-deazaguanine synthase [Phycisphaerales bacterium]